MMMIMEHHLILQITVARGDSPSAVPTLDFEGKCEHDKPSQFLFFVNILAAFGYWWW